MTSAHQWFPNLPAHWEIARLGACFEQVREPVNEELGIVTVFRDGQVTLRSNRRSDGYTEATDYSLYQVIKPGQLAIHNMDAFAGAIGVSDSHGMCSPVVSVCRPKTNVNAKYFSWVLREMARSGWIEANAKSVRERTSEFRWPVAKSQLVPLPPRAEQDAIAEFLDHELVSIDRLIEKQLKLIEAIKLRFQTLLDEYVTGGFRSNQMKPTSHPWLTKIPSNWTMGRLKVALRSPVTDGPHTTPVFEPEGFPFLSVDGIQDGELIFENCRYVSEPDFVEFSKKARPELGDILMGKAASVGKIARVKTSKAFAIWSPLALLKIDKTKFDSSFIEFYLKSTFVQSQIQANSNANTQQNLGMNQIPNLVLVYPHQKEQVEIANAISAQLAISQQTISKAVEVVDRLRERRQALIISAVTGKITTQVAE